MAAIYTRFIGVVGVGLILTAALSGCQRKELAPVEAAWQQVKADPSSADAHLALAQAYADAEQYNDAYVHYRRVFELNPQSFEAACQLTRICLKLQDPQNGRKWIDQALEIDPQSGTAYELRGRLTIAEGNAKGAITDFRKALALDPKLTIAYLNLVTAAKASGDEQAALQAAATAVKLAPDQASAHFAYGDILELTGSPAGAEKEFRSAIKLDRDFAPAKLRLAMLLTAQKRHLPEARELAKQAQMLEPADGSAEAVAAWALVLMGEEHQGLTELQHAAQAHPFNHIIWLRFAQALQKAGHEEQAQKAAAIAIRVAPRRSTQPPSAPPTAP